MIASGLQILSERQNVGTLPGQVATSHLGPRFRNPQWFFFTRRPDRLARRHGAEAASACADVPQNHERRGTVLPALAHVRAARAFADGVQIERAHDALQILVALATEKFDAQPIRAGRWTRRGPRHRRGIRDDVERCGHGAKRQTFILRLSKHTVQTAFCSTKPSPHHKSMDPGVYLRVQHFHRRMSNLTVESKVHFLSYTQAERED